MTTLPTPARGAPSAGVRGAPSPGARWTPSIADLVDRGTPPTPSAIASLVRAAEVELGGVGVQAEQTRLERSLLGLGELGPLVDDPAVTDVLVNGDGQIWIDRGGGVQRAHRRLSSPAVRALAVRLAGVAGRRLDDAQPWVDGQLPGGIRLHAVLSPVVVGGAHVSLRIPRVAPAGIDGLVAIGAVDADGADVLRRIVSARLTFVIVGGTGSGKTTALGALVSACPAQERIVVVEDVRELAPQHPHVVQLQGRAPNVEGVGGVGLVELVRQSLRMRPDRLVVGEVRGGEVRELLAAFNTGHRGGGGTVHANTTADLPARLEALGALAGMSARAVATQVIGGIDVVLGMRRRGAVRALAEVAVLRRVGEEVVADLAVDCWGTGRSTPGAARLRDLAESS